MDITREQKEWVLHQLDLLEGVKLEYTVEALAILLDDLVDVATLQQIQPRVFRATTIYDDEVDITVSIIMKSGDPDMMEIEFVDKVKPTTSNVEDDFDEI